MKPFVPTIDFLRLLAIVALAPLAAAFAASWQDTTTAPPTEHLLGTVTATDPAGSTITVKDDKTGAESLVSLGQTRSIFRVQPGAKDLKNATRIAAADLNTGDRVDVRGFKDSAGTGIVARSVVLMSARDLAEKHQQEIAAWQNSTVGTVSGVDASAHSLSVAVRTPAGPKAVSVQTSASTTFTRYSPANPKTPAAADFASIQPGDQLHIIGQKSEDGSSIAADKIYSAAVRNVAATIVSIAPDGKQMTVRNLQTKQPVTVMLTDDSAIRKLPPEMAAMLARRFNPGANPGGGSGQYGSRANGQGQNAQGAQPSGAMAGGNAAGNGSGYGGPGAASPGGTPGSGPRRGGDLSRLLERVPLIKVNDLQPGNAVVIWGVAGADSNELAANIVLAGVEPVLQSAPARQGQSLNANWNLDMSVPAQ